MSAGIGLNNQKEAAMNAIQPLPTANERWGFWGTSKQNGYDAKLTWDTACSFLAKHFDLTAEQCRTLLDSRFGRHLADDLSFIEGGNGIANGPTSDKAIIKHLEMRIADKGWRDCFENAIRQETNKTYPRKKLLTKDELFTKIAQEHLLVETLEDRMMDSLDFHSVSVRSIKAALGAAYEAGRASKK